MHGIQVLILAEATELHQPLVWRFLEGKFCFWTLCAGPKKTVAICTAEVVVKVFEWESPAHIFTPVLWPQIGAQNSTSKQMDSDLSVFVTKLKK